MLDKDKLMELLKSQWTVFIDKTVLIRRVVEDVTCRAYPMIETQVKPQMRFSVTNFEYTNEGIVFWVEFTVPNDDRIIIGTNVYKFDPDGGLDLTSSYGASFCQKSDDI